MVRNVAGFSHGRQHCRACFKGGHSANWHIGATEDFKDKSRDIGTRWTLRPNPDYWGDHNPKVLVLGFSKGGDREEMIDLYRNGRKRFEDVPFNSTKGTMRKDLAELLVATLGLVDRGESIDRLFENASHGFGFASLIRCSVEMAWPGKASTSSGDGILSRTMEANLSFVAECLGRYLARALLSVRLVVLLGADEKYVHACRKRLSGHSCGAINETPFVNSALGKTFFHLPHPSGQAGGFCAVFNNKRAPNKSEEGMLVCRKQALAAVAAILNYLATPSIEGSSSVAISAETS